MSIYSLVYDVGRGLESNYTAHVYGNEETFHSAQLWDSLMSF